MYFLRKNAISLMVILLILALLLVSGRTSTTSARMTKVEPSVGDAATGSVWPMSGSFVYEAGTTLADLDDDGKLEVVVGGRELNADGSLGCGGKLYVYRSDGTVWWEKTVRAGVNSSPAVADINGDGVKDVIAGMGAWHDSEVKHEDRYTECGIGNPDAPGNGGLVALDGRNGAHLWTFDTQDWGEWGMGSSGEMVNGVLDGVFSSPAVGDVNSDGSPEIAFGSWDNCIYLLDSDGQPLWDRVPFDYRNPEAGLDFCGGHGFFNHDTVWSSPAMADLTGDGQLEIIVGGDISCDVLGDPDLCNRYMEPNGGHLWVIGADGTPLARRWMDQAIYSSPAVTDLENDGVLDIVVGTGQGFANTGYYITSWNLDTSLPFTESLVLKWKTDVVGRTFSSPAIGDLDGDGVLDVVIIVKYGEWGIPVGPEANQGSYVYAFRGSDGAVLWQTHICNNDSIGRSFPVNASPVLADITGDDLPEVFFPHAWEVGVLNPDGTYYSQINIANGCADNTGDVLYSGNGSFSASVAVADLEGDGDIELIAPSRLNENASSLQGGIYVWSGHPGGKLHWPMFRYDASHSGYYSYPEDPCLALNTEQFTVLHQYGDTNDETIDLRLVNEGSGSFSCYIDVPGCMSLCSTSLVVVEQESQVEIAIPTTGYLPGTYSLGDISITCSADGEAVLGSPISVSTTLYVGDVHNVFLPISIIGLLTNP